MSTTVRSSELEQRLLDEVSRERLHEYVSTIAKDERMSGSPEEREAMDYVAKTLRDWDIEVHEYTHDGYVSKPVSASLQVTAPEQTAIDCTTHAFAVSGSLSGKIIYAGSGDDAAYQDLDVEDRIVLVEGLATPGKVLAAERHGAAGVICINDHNLHQMIVTPIWGTPTPDDVRKLPQTVVVSIKLEDGNQLKRWLEDGPVSVEIEAEVWTGWADLPVVVGEVKGAIEPDKFVMLAGHIDSWFIGAIDNAAANATTLEVMRILAAHRDQLRRSFRIVIWSGHSHGRYAGSTWYADTFWEDLHDNCVAYVNVDSTGAMQATLYEEILAMPEVSRLARDVIADLTGQTAEVNRVGRAGDQSFWGIGVPSVFMSLSRVPIETAPELSKAMGALTGRKKSGQAWFWHTEFDTLDKVDPDVLETDTKIYLSAILRLLNSPVLPFEYEETANELSDAATHYQSLVGDALDLQPILHRIGELRQSLAALQSRLPDAVGDRAKEDRANQALMEIAHALVPINYTEASGFDHDPALHAPALAPLQSVSKLAKLDPESDEYRFLRTYLGRRRNQVMYALRRAKVAADQVLADL